MLTPYSVRANIDTTEEAEQYCLRAVDIVPDADNTLFICHSLDLAHIQANYLDQKGFKVRITDAEGSWVRRRPKNPVQSSEDLYPSSAETPSDFIDDL